MSCCRQGCHNRETLLGYLEKYRNEPHGLIQVLSKIQETEGYLPRDLLVLTAEQLGLSLTEVYGTASFYALFSFRPRGRHSITLCNGTACYVKGAGRIQATVEKELQVRAGDTTEDRRFSVDVVRCIGCCALTPVMVIDDDVYAGVDPEKVPGILAKYE